MSMPICCPCCLRPYPSATEQIAERVGELRHACELHEIEIIDECYVDERAAAKLLGFDNHRSLANRRFIDQPLRFRKIGRRIEYRIDDLAAFTLAHESAL